MKKSLFHLRNPLNNFIARNTTFYIRNVVLVSILLLSVGNKTKAQTAAQYSFASSTITYTPIAGTLAGFANGWDNSVTGAISLGFNFTYCGNIYTSIYINSNGFITFGSPSLATLVKCISNNAAYAGAFGGLSMDLISSNAAGNQNVSYLSAGTAGNHIFTVQWANVRKFGGNAAGDNMNFQIKLYENGNKLEVSYGSFTQQALVTDFAQIGLRGANNTDFNNRDGGGNVITAWTVGNTNIAGTVNTDKVLLGRSGGNTIIPSTGETFTWTPPVNCSGQPVVTITGPSAVCTNTAFSITSLLATPAAGITYQWYSASALAGPYVPIPLATGTIYSSAGIASTTYYELITHCSFSNQDYTSNIVTVVASAALCPCIPTSSFGCSTDWISNVTLSTINNTTTCGAAANYYSIFYTPNPSITAGSSYPISISTHGTVGGDDGYVWIDFNGDGIFQTSENVFNGYSPGTGNNHTYTGTVTVPVNAVIGPVLMRVRCEYYASGYPSPDPCALYSYGETEDYMVTIVPPPLCTGTPSISGPSASPSTIYCSGTPTLTLASYPSTVGGITYQWQSGPTAAGPWTNVGAPVSNSPLFTAPAISTNTYYQCIATCTNTNQSVTSSPAVLVTVNGLTVSPATASMCLGTGQLITATVPSVPPILYSNDFEGVNTMVMTNTGAVATQFNVVNSPYTYANAGGDFISPGNNHFELAISDASMNPTNTQITSPLINTSGYTNLTLTFNTVFEVWNTNGLVQVSTDGGTTWTTVLSVVDIGLINAFAPITINLNAYVNQPNFKFRFNYQETWGFWWGIDDIVLSSVVTTPQYSWSSNPAANAGIPPAAANPSPSNNTVTVTPTATGVYTYTVTTNLPGSCTSGTSVVTVTPTPTATMTVATNPLCSGQSTTVNFAGTPNATVTYMVGAGPNQNVVLSGAGTASVNTGVLVTNTTYTLVSVGNGCTTTYNTSITITINPSPVFNAGSPSSNSPVCSGGSLNLFASTTPPGTGYSWTGPAFGTPDNNQNPVVPNAQASYSGVYSVTASIGTCSVSGTTTVVVNQTPSIAIAGSTDPATCSGNQGTITLSGMLPNSNYTLNYTLVTPVTAPITSNASGQYVISGLTAGTYTGITVTQNACPSNTLGPVTLSDPAPPAISGVTATNPVTCGGNQGTITVSGLLANTAYTLSYNNVPQAVTTDPSGKYVVTNLIAGTYNNIYVVRFACTSNIVGPVTLSDPVLPTIVSITPTDPTSCGGSQGIITLNVDSSVTPISGACVVNYTSSVTGPQTVNLNAVNGVIAISGLPAGSYTNFSFTTTYGCASIVTPGPVVLSGPVLPTIVSISSVGPTSCSGTQGSITLSVDSAATPINGACVVNYTSSVTGPQTINLTAVNGLMTITNLPAGTYTNFSFTTTYNCTSAVTPGPITLSDPAPPVISGTSSASPSTCLGTDGIITLSGLLNNTSYAVSYDNGVTTFTPVIVSNGTGNVIITNLPAGTYNNINVTLNNCTSANVGPVNVVDPNPPVVSAFSNAPICEGQALNFSSIVTLNGNPAIANSYSWTGPAFANPVNQANPSVLNAPATASGVYTVTATIANCTSAPFTVPVTVNAAPPIPSPSANTPLCSGNDLHLDVTNPVASNVYVWTGPGFVTPDTTTNAVISNAQTTDAGAYTISVTSQNGCNLLAPVTINVVINQAPGAPIPNDVVYCQADVPVALTATPSGNPNDTLKWYTVPTGGVGTTTAPIPSTATAGNFTWYVSQTTQPGCEGIRAVQNVWVKTKPNAPTTTAPAFTYCQFDSTAVPLVATGDSLQWYTQPTGGVPSSIVPTPPTTVPGTFHWYVTQTDDGCESNRLPIAVTIIAKPQPPLTTDVKYCQYDVAVPLTAIGQNLKWYDSPLGGTPLAAAPVPSTALPAVTTWYVSQTQNGCESNPAAITVTVSYKPTAAITSSRDEVCQNDTLLFTYTGNGTQTTNYNWTWPLASTVVSGTGQGPYVVRFAAVGEQTITLITSENGCSSPLASHTISVKQTPKVSIGLRSNIVCTDEPAYIEITSVDMEVASYAWDFAGAHSQSGAATENGSGPYYLNWSQPGKYVVTLDVTAKDQCDAKATDTVVVHERPVAKISTSSAIDNLCTGDDVLLSSAENKYKYTFRWLPVELFDNPESNAVVTVHADRTQYVTLEVTNEYGCSSMDSILLNTKSCCQLSLPSAFSPNGDGKNDLFRIINSGRHHLESLRVYNRYGVEVFSTSSEKVGWDGSYNGVAQDMGVYQYLVKYICDGKETYQKGDVTLVR